MSNQKNINLQETISALVDDEVTELELHRSLQALSEDDELRQKWRRYQMVEAVIRRERSMVAVDNSRQIAEAIEREAGHSEKRWGQSIGRFAVAASVMGLTLLGIQLVQNSLDNQGLGAVDAVVQSPVNSTSASKGNTGPQFQLPSGFEMPRLNTRTVSAGTGQQQVGSEQNFQGHLVDQQTHRQIKAYLHRLILRHAEQTSLSQSNYGTLPFARITSQKDEQ